MNKLAINLPELVFTFANAHRKISLTIYFIYFSNTRIYHIFKTCCIIT